jgi:hypothetical protein
MSDQALLKSIVPPDGLRKATEAVMQGSTPDLGKWSGVNSFVRTYSKLAVDYAALTAIGLLIFMTQASSKAP